MITHTHIIIVCHEDKLKNKTGEKMKAIKAFKEMEEMEAIVFYSCFPFMNDGLAVELNELMGFHENIHLHLKSKLATSPYCSEFWTIKKSSVREDSYTAPDWEAVVSSISNFIRITDVFKSSPLKYLLVLSRAKLLNGDYKTTLSGWEKGLCMHEITGTEDQVPVMLLSQLQGYVEVSRKLNKDVPEEVTEFETKLLKIIEAS